MCENYRILAGEAFTSYTDCPIEADRIASNYFTTTQTPVTVQRERCYINENNIEVTKWVTINNYR